MRNIEMNNKNADISFLSYKYIFIKNYLSQGTFSYSGDFFYLFIFFKK